MVQDGLYVVPYGMTSSISHIDGNGLEYYHQNRSSELTMETLSDVTVTIA